MNEGGAKNTRRRRPGAKNPNQAILVQLTCVFFTNSPFLVYWLHSPNNGIFEVAHKEKNYQGQFLSFGQVFNFC